MPANACKDLWLTSAWLSVLAVYVALFFIHPTGENWGYGWNMIAFLIYASPVALIAAALAAWRSGKVSGAARMLARVTLTAGMLFPVICMLVLKAKA